MKLRKRILLPLITLNNITKAFYVPGFSENTYLDNEKVPLFVNKATSDNTQLPYSYNELPFVCKVKDGKHHGLNLGEVLRGDRIVSSDYDLSLGKNEACVHLCDKVIGKSEIERARDMIANNYVVEWILDNLPGATPFTTVDKNRKYYASGFKLGYFNNDVPYINNHVTLLIRYRKSSKEKDKKVIIAFEVYTKSIASPEGKCPQSLKDQPSLALTLPAEGGDDAKLRIPYTYSVYWEEDNSVEWANRWDLYFVNNEESSKIHWLAIINSLVIAFMLTAMTGVVLVRTLSRDIKGYNEKGVVGDVPRPMKRLAPIGEGGAAVEDAGEDDVDDDELIDDITGWKLVHGDIFRPPQFGGLLAPVIGSGAQLLATFVALLILAAVGVLNPSYRGGFISFALFLFVFAGCFCGYFSGRIYKTFGGENWFKNALLTALLIPGTAFAIVFVLNLFVWGQASSSALPFSTLLALVCMWLLISLPLVILGTWYGFKQKPYEHPTRATQIPRQVPTQPYYLKTVPSVLLGGLIPFAVIFIELLFVFKSMWQDKSGYYYMYGFLALIMLILLVTIVEITIVITYFQLCAENYHWWWRSFLVGGGSAFWVFLYSVWYYLTKLHIQGFVSGLLFFSYSFLGCAIFAILGGTIGFLASYAFVRRIYTAIKAD